MKKSAPLVLVLALTFLIGCADDVRDDDYDVEGVQSEIEATNARFESYVSGQQWDSLAALYTDDAIMMPQGAPMQRGPNAIREGFAQMGQQGGVSNIQLETVEVEASGDLAYEIGQYTLEGQGGTQIDRGKYLVVWRRDGDTWRLHRDIFNSDSVTSGLPQDTTTVLPEGEGGIPLTPEQQTDMLQDDTVDATPGDTPPQP